MNLSPLEVRVLASLVEKDLATPEYYPLTLNALVAACNQKSNRAPVVQFGPDEVHEALFSLQKMHLAGVVSGAGSRVEKYRHALTEALRLAPDALSILAELMLRGAQTAGELRVRASRMHPFPTVETVQAVLASLAGGGEPLVMELPVQAGRKENRFAHLLSGEPDVAEEVAVMPLMTSHTQVLGEEVASLRERVEALEEAFTAFRAQFE